MASPLLHLPRLQSRAEGQWFEHNGKSLYAQFTQVLTGVSNMHVIVVLLARREVNPAKVRVHSSEVEGQHRSQGPKPGSSTLHALQRRGERQAAPYAKAARLVSYS